MNSDNGPQPPPRSGQSTPSLPNRARKITLPIVAVLWATGSVFGSIIGPYTPDANTVYLFHFDESAGASTAVNASGSLAFGTNAIPYDGNPYAGDGLTQPTVTTVLGAPAFPGFGHSANLSEGTDLGLGVDRDLSGSFGQGDNNPVAPDQFPDHSTIFGAGNAFTVEAAIKVSTITSGNQQIVCTDANAATADRGLIFRINGSGLLEWHFVGSSSTLAAAIPTSGDHAFNSNAWFHVAAVYDGASVSLYWTRMNSDFTSANLLTSAARTVDIHDDAIIIIGNEGRAASGEGLKGQIDEVRISNLARGAGQFLFGPNPDPFAGTTGISPATTVYPGTPVTLSARATGTAPLGYFWQTDGGTDGVSWSGLPGSTSNSYAINTASLANTTNQYRLVVTNSLGSATGAVATLIVLPDTAPTLTADTTITPLSVALGFPATLSASFVGNPPLYYQWQYASDTNGTGLVDILGATNASFTLTNAQYRDAGAYRLVASNTVAGGSVSNSSFAPLAVRPVVIISVSPTDPTPGTDDIAQLSSDGDSRFPDTLNYYDDNGTKPGQTFTTGSHPNGYTLNALYYKCGGPVVSDGSHGAGVVYTLRIYSMAGGAATLLSTYVNDNTAPAVPNNVWAKWTGGLTNHFSPNATYAYSISAGEGFMHMGNSSNSPSYYANGELALIPTVGGTVTFGASHNTDAAFMVNVVPAGYPAVQIVGISPASSPALPLYGGQPVTLNVQAIGAAPLHYQWQTDHGLGGAFSDLSGSDTNSHTFDTASLPAGTYQYQVIVTNNLASATSSVVTLNLLSASGPMLATNTIITPSAAFVGNTVQMRAAFSGTPPIAYQWKFDDGSGPVAIAGATNTTYTIANVVLGDSGAYFVTASNAIGGAVTVSSDPALLTVASPPQTNTISAAILDGGGSPPPVGAYDIAQLVSAPPTLVPGLNYYVDNSAPPGQTFTTGTNPPSAAGYPLNSVWLREELSTVGNGGDTPQTYTLGIYSVTGSNVALVTSYTSTNTLAITEDNWIQWTGLTNILKTNSTYAFSIKRNGIGWWKVANNSTATDLYDGGQAVSLPASGAGWLIYSTDTTIDAAFLIGLTPPTAPIVLQETTITPSHAYAGNTAMARAVFSGLLPISYQWQFTDTNGLGPINIPGATNHTYIIASVGPADAGRYSLVASNFYGGIPNLTTSTPALLSLQPAPSYFVANFSWSDPYSGPGAFPSGTFWNRIDSSGRNQTSLSDDGSTDLYLGFTSARTWAFYNGGGIPLFAAYMLNQGSTALPFAVNNLPAGVYHLILYAANGHYRFSRTIFTIGDTTNSASTTADEWFAEGDNYVVFTNLVPTQGTISGSWQRGAAEAAFNGVQVVMGYSFENPAINIAIHPSNTVAAVGQPTSLSVLAFGPPPLHYQWRADGTAIPLATNRTLAFPAVSLADGAPGYDVVMSNLSGLSVTSSVATLTVRTSADSLLWRGYSSDWDFASGNWQNTVSLADPVSFQPGDSVLFDDTTSRLRVILAGRLMPGSVTVNTSTNYDFTGAGFLSGGMSLNVAGGLTLRRPHDYTGDTVLSPGATLALAGAGSTARSSNIVLGAGATLNASARTDATLSVNSSQTLKGDGAFNVTGTVINSGMLEFKADKTSGVITSDRLQGMTGIVYGGNLKLNLAGEALSAGDAIKLFAATTYSGAFTTIMPATPGTGLLWNTSTLASDGTLRVANVINVDPVPIGGTLSGNSLTLFWPADHTGWRLLVQTNRLQNGISSSATDWGVVSGSASTNRVDITIDTAKPTEFYRLVYP